MFHERVILLSVEIERVPIVPASEKIKIKTLNHGFYQIDTHFGYMEKPDIPSILKKCNKKGYDCEDLKNIDVNNVSYYLGRETLLTTGKSKMLSWQKKLFAYLSKNAKPASAFFEIPANRVVELGQQIEI